MAHTEKATQERYKFAKEKKIPYGRLEDNDEYLDMRKDQARKYRDIATANPLVRPSETTYNPAAGNVTNKPAASSSGTPKERPNERTINGQVWVRQPDGSYKPKAQ
jgi:hypothetical protein